MNCDCGHTLDDHIENVYLDWNTFNGCHKCDCKQCHVGGT